MKMPTEMRSRHSPQGFTLIEILMVLGMVVVMIGTVSLLLVQFKRSFTKGEESSVVLQESGMFLAMLRNDFINAVMPREMDPALWREAIRAEPDLLAFNIYRDAEGTIEPVVYRVTLGKTLAGRSVTRSVNGGSQKTLVDTHLASMSWSVGSDVLPGIGSGVRQLWLNIDMTLGGQGKQGTKAKILNISTKLFPTRMNRQINSQ